MPRGRTILNRSTLALTGLVSLVAGAWLSLSRAPGAPHLPGPHTALVNPEQLAALRDQAWWTPTVTTVSVAATLLLAFCCARQLRGGSRRHVPLPVPGSVLRTRALQDALTSHAVAHGDIDHCRTRVRVRPDQLDVALRVQLRQDSTPAAVLPALAALARDTEATVAPYSLRMHVRFTTSPRGRTHVR
ncbi:hypothetical protein [Streptomyces sp. NPDC050264]|uniref:hypothetical protein n=1 Tax=Streptomyces sp. NPDC050264 TaxID=3155038 RepID=UPI003446CA6F